MSSFRQLMMKRFHSEANYMDLTVVGSPTISNNVVSNFSTVDYVNSNVPFNPVNGVWEVGIKLTTGDTSQEAAFFRSAISAPANAGRYGISLTIQDAQFKAAFSFDGNSWVVPPRIITYTVQSNTTYFVKCGWTGSVYYMDFSLDDVTYTRVISYDSSNGIYDGLTITQFGIFSYDNKYALPWLGSIDFNSSYIKLNGVKYQFRFTMPLTKAGSPTITDGVVSGFSNSNYLDNPCFKFNNNFSLKIKFKTFSDDTRHYICSYANGGIFRLIKFTDNKLIINIGTAHNSFDIGELKGTTIIQNYVDYYALFSFDGSVYKLFLSTDDINYNLEGSLESNTIIKNGDTFQLNFGRGNAFYLDGSIDLNYTYMILDGTKYIFTV